MSRTVRRIAIVAALVVAGHIVGGTLAPVFALDGVAHRGWVNNSRVVENSHRALDRAARHGNRVVEIDVRLTRDRKMVVMHDKSLGRTTTGRGYVDQHRKRHIRKRLRLEDGQRVPFLTNLLTVAKQNGQHVVVEIKADRLGRWDPRDFRAMAALVQRKGMWGRVSLLSFNKRLLQTAQPYGIPTVWIRGVNADKSVATALAAGVDGVAVLAGQMSQALVTEYHLNGLVVYGRNTNRAGDWRQLDRMGVDRVLTDAAPRFERWDRRN